MNESLDKVVIPQDTDTRPEPEKVFESLLITNVAQAYIDDMKPIGYREEEIERFLTLVNAKNHEDRRRILSLPFELRKNVLKEYLKELRSGKMTLEEIVEEFLETSNEFGFDIGYHTTPFQIKKEALSNGQTQWNVKGSENDHRDNDLMMAYYSKDLENIYMKKDFNYIYIIRSSKEHRTDGNWYRAPILPIISEIKMSSAELQDKFTLYRQEFEKAHTPN